MAGKVLTSSVPYPTTLPGGGALPDGTLLMDNDTAVGYFWDDVAKQWKPLKN